MISGILVFLMLSGWRTSTHIVELQPVPPMVVRSSPTFAAGNLWLGGLGSLWRFNSSGEGEEFRLDGQVVVTRIFPRGGGVDVLAGHHILRLGAGRLDPVVDLEGHSGDAVPVGDGWIGLNEHENALYHVLRGRPPRRLEFFLAGAGGGDASEEDGGVPKRATITFLPGHGVLVPYGEDRVLFVQIAPYQVWELALDGTARVIAVREPETSTLTTLTDKDNKQGYLPKSNMGVVTAGRLYVDRVIRERHLTDDGVPTVRPHGYVDVINLDSGLVEDRLDLRTLFDDSIFVGVKGEGSIALFQYLGPSGPVNLAFASVEP